MLISTCRGRGSLSGPAVVVQLTRTLTKLRFIGGSVGPLAVTLTDPVTPLSPAPYGPVKRALHCSQSPRAIGSFVALIVLQFPPPAVLIPL